MTFEQKETYVLNNLQRGLAYKVNQTGVASKNTVHKYLKRGGHPKPNRKHGAYQKVIREAYKILTST